MMTGDEMLAYLREAARSGRIDSSVYQRVRDYVSNTAQIQTCHVVSDEKFFGSYGCEEAGTRFVLSCGHENIVEGDYPPSYCSECGARVVSGDD